MGRLNVETLLCVAAMACMFAACDRKEASAGTPAAAVDKASDNGQLTFPGKQGKFTFEVHLRPHPPVVGQFFKAVTTVRDAKTNKPVGDGTFTLDATMPSHGHGMMTEPKHKAAGPGMWVSEGMKLHMHGPWRISAVFEGKDGKDSGHIKWEQPPGTPAGSGPK